MLAYLLDEQISRVVAEQVRAKRPDISIESVHRWRGGALLSADDSLILRAAREEMLTLVTYDVSTITPILVEWVQAGFDHAGVLFISHSTIPSSDFGGLVQGLITCHELHGSLDWTDRVMFLPAAPRQAS